MTGFLLLPQGQAMKYWVLAGLAVAGLVAVEEVVRRRWWFRLDSDYLDRLRKSGW